MREKLKKYVSGKGFYVISVLSIISAVVAFGIIYRTAVKLPEEILMPRTTLMPTRQAQMPHSEVPDPRAVSETTKERTTEKQTIAQTESVREESTAIEPISTTINEAEVFSNDGYILPVKDAEIVKEFSPTVPVYDETMDDWRVHSGADFKAAKGDEIVSVGNGMVKKIIADPSFGFIAEIDYGDFSVRYCGLQQGTVLKPDSIVKKGDVVGKLGTIPCESESESHLHIEVIENDVYKDPMKVFGE